MSLKDYPINLTPQNHHRQKCQTTFLIGSGAYVTHNEALLPVGWKFDCVAL